MLTGNFEAVEDWYKDKKKKEKLIDETFILFGKDNIPTLLDVIKSKVENLECEELEVKLSYRGKK